MAQINFKDYSNGEVANSSNSNSYKVDFFKLKNDNDEAIVRFVYDSPDEFDLQSVHRVKVGKAFRPVSCIRGPHEPLDHCPFCKKGEKLYFKFYVKLVEYVRDEETGAIKPEGRIWERPASFATTLADYFQSWGPLKDNLFKIKRHGAPGSMNTTYELQIANKQVYKDEIYVKDFSAFDDYKLEGRAYLNKSWEEINTFIQTGEFPSTRRNEENKAPVNAYPQNNYIPEPAYTRPAPQAATPHVAPTATPVYQQPQGYVPPAAPVPTPVNPAMGSGTEPQNPTMARPRRVYDY